MGKLQLFNIVFDEASGVYKAGDTLRGQVHLQLTDTMHMRSKHSLLLSHSLVLYEPQINAVLCCLQQMMDELKANK